MSCARRNHSSRQCIQPVGRVRRAVLPVLVLLVSLAGGEGTTAGGLPACVEYVAGVPVFGLGCSDGGGVSTKSTSSSTPKSWIVLQRDKCSLSDIEAACNEAAAVGSGRFNGLCTAQFHAVFSGFSAQFDDNELRAFLSTYANCAHSVHADVVLHLSSIPGPRREPRVASSGAGPHRGRRLREDGGGDGESDVPWGLDRIDQRSLPLDGQFGVHGDGSGVHAYIIDTGIRTSHNEFRYADGRPGSRADEPYASTGTGNVAADCNGHGTHVAANIGGLRMGVARNVSLHALRSLDCDGNAAVSQVVAALDWVVDNAQRPAVVVLSLGGQGQSPLDNAVRAVVAAGIPAFVAAGNEDIDACDVSPARELSAITVAASDREDQRLWLHTGSGSNYGSCIDIFAPGRDVLSADNDSDAATLERSGTSQAAPLAAGVAALYLEHASDAGPADVKRALVNAAARGQVGDALSAPWVMADTPNVLLQAGVSGGLSVRPASIKVCDSGDGRSFGPYEVRLRLQRAPAAGVEVALTSSDADLIRLAPATLTFDSSNWSDEQAVVVELSPDAALVAADALPPLSLHAALSSGDASFDGLEVEVPLDDCRGDHLSYPYVIAALPFSVTGSTFGRASDFSWPCNAEPDAGADADAGGGGGTSSGASSGDGDGSASDVVYYFKPRADVAVTISTCESATLPTSFDTKLYLLEDVEAAGWDAAAGPSMCSDDGCLFYSKMQAQLRGGVAYAIVVDGHQGRSGGYVLSVSADDGGAVEGLLPGQTLPAEPQLIAAGKAKGSREEGGAVGAGETAGEPAGSEDAGGGEAGEGEAAAAAPRWQTGPWARCSSTCGHGTRTRTVLCVAGASGDALDDGVCAAEGRPRPPAEQPCSAAACEAFALSPLLPPSGPGRCAAAPLDTAVALCGSDKGRLAPGAACLPMPVLLDLYRSCPSAGVSGGATWHVTASSECSAPCGGGLATQRAVCLDADGNEVADGPSACGPLAALGPLQRPCNTMPCDLHVWQVSGWSDCGCDDRESTRSVTCVRAATGAPASNASACAASPPPPAVRACPRCESSCGGGEGRPPCGDRGACDGGQRCTCGGGWRGVWCEVPPGCDSGAVDARGRCCQGAVDVAGNCCGAGRVLDGTGACCEGGRVDACGVCGGAGLAVDVAGTCCEGPLDGQGVCCAQGALDVCGVCGGDGASCALLLAAEVALSSAAEEGGAGEADGGGAAGGDALGGALGGADGVEGVRGALAELLRVEPWAVATMELAADDGDDASQQGVAASSLPAPAGGGGGARAYLAEAHPDAGRRRLLDSGGGARGAVLWVELRPGATAALGGGGDETAVTAAAALRALADAARSDARRQLLPGGRAVLLNVTAAAYVPVCGNGVCEAGEAVGDWEGGTGAPAPPGTPAPLAARMAAAGCPDDCPIRLHDCAGGGHGPECSAHGSCLRASGMCACYEGFSGDRCDACAAGYLPTADGGCLPEAVLAAAAGGEGGGLAWWVVPVAAVGGVVLIGALLSAAAMLACIVRRRRTNTAVDSCNHSKPVDGGPPQREATDRRNELPRASVDSTNVTVSGCGSSIGELHNAP